MNALNDDLLEQVLAVDNLNAAWKAVKANRGAAGIDGIGIDETAAHVRRHWNSIKAKLLAGTYKPALVAVAAAIWRWIRRWYSPAPRE